MRTPPEQGKRCSVNIYFESTISKFYIEYSSLQALPALREGFTHTRVSARVFWRWRIFGIDFVLSLSTFCDQIREQSCLGTAQDKRRWYCWALCVDHLWRSSKGIHSDATIQSQLFSISSWLIMQISSTFIALSEHWIRIASRGSAPQRPLWPLRKEQNRVVSCRTR